MERNVVGWFEIPVKDFNRAKDFYSLLFDLSMEDLPMPDSQMAAFPMKEAEGAAGAIVRAEGYEPAKTGTIVYFSCVDVEVSLAKAVELGAEVVIPKTSIGEHGFIGHFFDLEGNRVALHSLK
ncbi:MULTISPECIES: VOC family protein [unclassified Saccharicrinis]|uniref:VOC family protein n=1 Tax=unclassified Saccharicrinis TaxID=2646859 RepID=UPI003D353CCB